MKYKRSFLSNHFAWRPVIAIGCIMAVLALAAATSANADSVVALRGLATRAQPPEVEAILKSLETKAKDVEDGKWTATLGQNGEPIREEKWGFGGRQWYSESRDGSKVTSLIFDGDDFFDAANRVVFSLETLEDQRWGYALGPIVFHANIRPRQILAGRPLQIYNSETVGSDECVVLRANVEADASSTEPFAAKREPWDTVRYIDYCYHPGRKAITRIRLIFADGKQTMASVETWDHYGTTGDYPKQVKGFQIDRAKGYESGGGKASAEVLVTSATAYDRGGDPHVAELVEAAHSVSTYSTWTKFLRRPSEYAKAVAANPSDLTRQILLAEAEFRAQMPREGLAHWKELVVKVPPASRVWLDQVFRMPAARTLLKPEFKNAEQAAACFELFKTFAATEVASDAWSELSTPVASGWAFYRRKQPLPEGFTTLERALLPRLVKGGSIGAISTVLKAASDPDIAAIVEPLISTELSQRVHAGVLRDSQHLQILSAALALRQLNRVASCLDTLAVDGEPSSEEQALLTSTRAATALDSAHATPEVFQELASIYQTVNAETTAASLDTRKILDSYLLSIGCRALHEALKEGDEQKFASLITSASLERGGPEYWDWVLDIVANDATDEQYLGKTIAGLRSLGVAYESTFGRSDYTSSMLMRIGGGGIIDNRHHMPAERVYYFEEAFTAAKTEELRLHALRAILGTYASAGQHEQAAHAMANFRSAGSSPEWTREIARLDSWLNARLQTTQRQALEAQIDYLSRQLAEYEHTGRSVSDIDSLRSVLAMVKAKLDQLP